MFLCQNSCKEQYAFPFAVATALAGSLEVEKYTGRGEETGSVSDTAAVAWGEANMNVNRNYYEMQLEGHPLAPKEVRAWVFLTSVFVFCSLESEQTRYT